MCVRIRVCAYVPVYMYVPFYADFSAVRNVYYFEIWH